jgi:hypothetical protein
VVTRWLAIACIVLFVGSTLSLGGLYLFGARRERDGVLLTLGVSKVAIAIAFVVGITFEPVSRYALGLAMLLLLAQFVFARIAQRRIARPAS